MLGKFMKYEAKASGKIMLLLCAALVAVTAIEGVLIAVLRNWRGETPQAGRLLLEIFSVVYILALLMALFGAVVYLCFRFYRSMFSEQGYLTHTLPMSSVQIFHAKLVTSFGWLVAVIFLALLSLSASGVIFLGGFREFAELLADVICIGQAHGGNIFVKYSALLAGGMLLASLYILLLFFAGFSVGQLSNANKGILGLVASIAFYFIGQIVQAVFCVACVIGVSNMAVEKALDGLIGGVYFIEAALCIALYGISRRVISRHLNLE